MGMRQKVACTSKAVRGLKLVENACFLGERACLGSFVGEQAGFALLVMT